MKVGEGLEAGGEALRCIGVQSSVDECKSVSWTVISHG